LVILPFFTVISTWTMPHWVFSASPVKVLLVAAFVGAADVVGAGEDPDDPDDEVACGVDACAVSSAAGVSLLLVPPLPSAIVEWVLVW
jgi:hypothetical protein